MMFGRGYNMLGNCFGWGSGYFYGGWGMMIAAGFIVLALAAIAISYLARKKDHNKTNDLALETLNIRFVKGEITEDEYIKRKNILG